LAPKLLKNWLLRRPRGPIGLLGLVGYSDGEQAGLPDVAFVGAEKFSEIYVTLHYYHQITKRL